MSGAPRDDAEKLMDAALQALRQRLSKLRTGKASPALLDGLKVDYYGTPTPLNQLATMAAPEARLLTVKPFDRNAIGEIEKAIRASNLGLNPTNDGLIIRIPIPELTEERRREYTKLAKEIGEEGKVAIRHARQDGNDQLKKLQKESEITEDELHAQRAEIQKLTDRFCAETDDIVKAKEAEMMEM